MSPAVHLIKRIGFGREACRVVCGVFSLPIVCASDTQLARQCKESVNQQRVKRTKVGDLRNENGSVEGSAESESVSR